MDSEETGEITEEEMEEEEQEAVAEKEIVTGVSETVEPPPTVVEPIAFRQVNQPEIKQEEEDELAEKMAEEMLVWLVRYRFKKEIEQVSRGIRDAQQAQDNDLLEELVIRKAELNRYIVSMDDGDDQ